MSLNLEACGERVNKVRRPVRADLHPSGAAAECASMQTQYGWCTIPSVGSEGLNSAWQPSHVSVSSPFALTSCSKFRARTAFKEFIAAWVSACAWVPRRRGGPTRCHTLPLLRGGDHRSGCRQLNRMAFQPAPVGVVLGRHARLFDVPHFMARVIDPGHHDGIDADRRGDWCSKTGRLHGLRGLGWLCGWRAGAAAIQERNPKRQSDPPN